MNKRVLIIAGVIVAMIAGAFIYLALNKPADSTSNQSTDQSELSAEPAESQPAPQPTPTTPAASAGAYKDYSANAISSTKGTKILFFHAPWCPQCRQLEASIKAGPIPDNVTIFKVDYDSNQQLRQKYGVTIQTSLVKVDDSGNLVKRYVAYDEPTLNSLKANLLP